MDEQDQDRLKKRAERFGDMLEKLPQPVPAAKPKRQPKSRARRQGPQQEGFKTGIDVYSQEELAKRQSRAKRFEIEEKALDYQPVEDPTEEQRKRRAQRFGTEFQAKDQSGLASEDILEARKDQSTAVERRPHCVHVYGVDRLSTREVQSYFQGFGPQGVEWIDDSSCNVVFADEHSAKRAMAEKGRPLELGQPGDQEGPSKDSMRVDASDISSLPFLWHRGPDYVKNDQSKVPLIFRMATVADKKGAAPAHPPRYLWLKSGQKAGQARGRNSQKRKLNTDADGNIEMTDAANDRPGAAKRARRSLKRLERQKERARAHNEVAMVEADQDGAIVEVPAPANGIVILPAPMEEDDPAELGAARAKQRAEGPSGLFSAAEAGLLSADDQPGTDGNVIPGDKEGDDPDHPADDAIA